MESSLFPGYKSKFLLNFVFYLVRNTNDIHIFWVLTMGQASPVHHLRCGIANGRHYVSLSWLEQTSALLKYVFSYLFWTWFQKPSQHCSPPHSSSLLLQNWYIGWKLFSILRWLLLRLYKWLSYFYLFLLQRLSNMTLKLKKTVIFLQHCFFQLTKFGYYSLKVLIRDKTKKCPEITD